MAFSVKMSKVWRVAFTTKVSLWHSIGLGRTPITPPPPFLWQSGTKPLTASVELRFVSSVTFAFVVLTVSHVAITDINVR